MALLAGALILGLAGPAQAAEFTVTSTLDQPDVLQGDSVCATDPSGPASGACTLRAAVQEANATIFADTIKLPANTFTLTRTGNEAADPDAVGDLDLLSDINIDGASGGSVVQAGTGGATPIDRVFDVSGSGTDVGINVLTIRNGQAGDGGAVRNGGEASLNLTKVTITEGNANDDGGGIFNSAALTVENSTISDNSANRGGGLFSSTATTSLTNVTIANNSATASGGGIHGAPSLESTIVAGNTPQNCTGGDSSDGYNVASDTSCSFTGGTDDLEGTDPKLGPLADNGGPTFTHALLGTSPAIDHVATSACPPPSTDQRNVARPQDGDQDTTAECDSGAYEAEPGADLALEKTDDPDPVRVDENLTYTITVTNQAGINSATNVEVTDTLPTSVTFVSASPGCTHSAGTVTCDLGTIAPGANQSVEIVVTPTKVEQISDTASVTSDTTDPEASNNSDTETTDVEMSLDPIPDPTTDNTPTYSGKASPGGGLVTVTVRDSGGQTVQERTASPNPTTGAYSVEGSPELPDGNYTAQATQGDDSSQERSFRVNAQPSETVFPDSVQANKGKVVSGGASNLDADDDSYFQVKTKSRSKKVSWSADFNGVPNDLSEFELVYKGMNSKSCTQKLKLFNFSNGSFETVNVTTVGPSEQQITIDQDDVSGDPDDYVSNNSGDGTFRVLVVCNGAKKNTSSGDLMQLTFDV